MGSTITEYEVVNEHEMLALKVAVNELISKGWQPFKSIQVSTPVINDGIVPLYTQAMVKYKKQPD
jgi:dimeric dUTPase (all-alpha-NTP-PPase superfamily)